MKYLAIDSSGQHLTVIAVNGNKQYVSFVDNCGVHHSVVLMNEVEKCLKNVDMDAGDVDFYAAVTGAGSFTGIRIGISTVKALAFAAKKPCLPVTSFDTLAYNKTEGKVLAVIDAGHGNYYVAGYNGEEPCLEPRFVSQTELDSLKKEYVVVTADKGVEGEKVSLSEGLKKAVLSKCRSLISPDELKPLYIRKSQAEEGR